MKYRAAIFLSVCVTIPTQARASTDSIPALDGYTRVSWTESEGLSASQVWAIAQDRDGYLWLGTDTGLIRFDGVRFVTWNTLHRVSPLVNSSVRSLLVAKDGSLWAGSGVQGNLYHVRADGTFARIATLPEKYLLALVEDSRGNLYIGPGGGGTARGRIALHGKPIR